jgi:hypothetical protein
MEHIEKEVREYLRAGDILIALLKTGKELSAEEVRYIEVYTTRIRSFLKFDTETGNGTQGMTVRFTKD